MTYEKTTLYSNDWLSLCSLRDPDPDGGVPGYVYSHETRCHGRIVAVLPYREDPGRSPSGVTRSYLARVEVTPCWSPEPVGAAVTGGWEGGDVVDDAVRELREETGFDVEPGTLIPLGDCRGTKSTDTLFTLYAVDVTGLEPGPLSGDGSPLEARASTLWLSEVDVAYVVDPLVAVMYVRLRNVFRGGSRR